MKLIHICNCSVPSQLQAKIHAKSPLAMGFLLGRGTLSYGQRSECADLLNSCPCFTLTGYQDTTLTCSCQILSALFYVAAPERLLFTGHCTGRRFHAGSMKIPRQPARYGAECSISVHREACYWTRSEQFPERYHGSAKSYLSFSLFQTIFHQFIDGITHLIHILSVMGYTDDCPFEICQKSSDHRPGQG